MGFAWARCVMGKNPCKIAFLPNIHDRNQYGNAETREREKKVRPTNVATKSLNWDKLGGLILLPEYLFDSSRKLQ